MAIQINVPAVGVLLQRAFQLQGRVQPVLEESIVPTVTLGDLSEGFAPAVTRKGVCVLGTAAEPGELYTLRLEIPGNVIAVIRRLHLQSSITPNNLRVHFPGNAVSINAQSSIKQKSFTDGRLLDGSGISEIPAVVVTDGTQIASLATVDLAWRVDNILTIENPGWVLGTGLPNVFGFIEIQLAIANTAVVGGLEWDEYQIV